MVFEYLGLFLGSMEKDPIIDAAALSRAIKKPMYERSIHKGNISEGELWKWRTLFGLVILAIQHYDGLMDANSRVLPLSTLAYHARCLLELVIWTKYALESDENIKLIDADALNDSMDLLLKLNEFANFFDNSFKLKTEEAKINLHKFAEKEGHKEPTKKYLRIKDLLKDDSWRFWYDVRMKLLSKLVHPCGFTIVGMDNEKIEKDLRPILVKEACRWFATVIKAVAPLVDLEITWKSES
jgi:hypothetical protein